jgi:Phage integrase family
VLTTLQALYNERIHDCPYAFAHATGRKAGEPVQDVKNAFQTALETAEIKDFTWHDLRHTFASWLIMKGASLRSVAELLGHRGLRMVMRYAHLSPEHLSAEVGLLDPTTAPSPAPTETARSERARKGQRAAKRDQQPAKVVEFPKGIGSSGWIRTSNPPVNRRKKKREPAFAAVCRTLPDRAPSFGEVAGFFTFALCRRLLPFAALCCTERARRGQHAIRTSHVERDA